MQNCITSAILLSFLLIFGVRPSAAQTKAPSIYNAYTGTDVKVVPPPPALGPANSVITDPTFGSRILRVTDANTKGGESFISTDSGFSRAWNANSTAIKLTGPFGDGYWMEFNPSTFQAGTGSGEPVLHPVSFGATWEWSAVQPNIIYYLSGSTIETYNTTTGASTPVASTPTGDPVAYMATVIGLDNWVCAAVGAGPQDTYTKIFCVSPSNPSLYKFIDVVNKTINGTAQSSPNWPTSAGGETIGIHDISGGTGPNWLEVTFHQQSWGGNGGAVFDLSTNTWSLVTNADPYWSGHVSMGNGRYENSSGSINGNDSRGTVLRDPDNLMNSSEYLFVMQPFAPWNGWCDAEHSSWLNSLTNPNAPILDSRYSANTACQFAWSDEIVAAAVDGSNTVWRFAHNFNGGSLCYYAQAFAQISNDGNWALFSSYWGGTLGPDKSFGCATRIDTFIVDLKDAGLPTANSVSPNSGAGASQVFTFQYSSVNGLGYLNTVYALISGSLNGVNACYVYYVPASNALYLYNDTGSAVAGPLTPGSGGTLSNSQCTLNGSGSSATGSGNTLALGLSVTFKPAFAGLQNVYGYAFDNGGNGSGWQALGAWNSGTPVSTPPTADSVSPSSGTGSSQVFTFRYSSANGNGYLSAVYALISGSLNGVNACYVYYVPASNALYLYNDTGSAVAGPLTPGSGGTLSNSQCTLNGSGSSATGSGNTLALGLSVTFKPAFAGLQNVYGYAFDNGGNGSGWQALGAWNSGTPVSTPPTADSVSPSSGTGSSQVFTFRYSSANGNGYLSAVYALISGSLNGVNACYVYYVPASNALYLYNDTGSAVAGPLTPGSGGTLSNSQCTLNGSGSSATGSGNTLALGLSVTFKPAFAGLQNVYGYAFDNGGNGSGWQALGAWNSGTPVSTPPTADSVSPSSGTGSSQVFTFRYSSVNGNGYLSAVYALISGSLNGVNACYVYYVPASNALYLYNDTGSAVAGPLTPGSGGTLSNSQCTLNGSGSSATGSGNTLALGLSVTFKPAFAWLQNVYGYAFDNGGNGSGWQALGAWNSGTPVSTPPTADSVSPSSGTGSSQVFTFRYSSVNGNGYLSAVYALISGSLNGVNACYVYYVPASNALYLYNDTGSAVAGPLTPGSGGTLSNSQCTLNGSGSSATGSGNTLALGLSVTFKPAFAGLQNVYGYAFDNGGNGSGWQALGAWNSGTPVSTPPTADSVSPSSGTGSSQVFTFRYSSVNGNGYLSAVYALISGSLNGVNACYVYYVPASNALYLYNDTGSSVTGPLTPGSGGTLSNSQCTLNGSGSSATGSGNTLALGLSVTFKPAFAGLQNVYGYAFDNGGNGSGWQTLGAWTQAAGLGAITVSNVTVGQGLQVPMMITFNPAPTFGVTDPVHGCDNPTTPGCLTVSSSNAAVMIQGHSGSSTQVVVPVAAGTTSLSLLVQAVGSPGATSTMTASAAGYTNGTGTTTISNSGFVLSGPNSIGGAFPTFQGVSTTLTVYAARLDANNLFVEPEEVMSNVTVPIAVVPNTIGTVSPTSLGFIAGTSSMTATFQASAVNTGGATVMLTQPSQPFQFTTPATGGSLNVTVSQSGYVAPTLTIGQNLEVPANVSITGNASSATTITLTSSDSNRLQFACLSTVEISKGGCSNGPAGTTTPTASGTITVSLPQNQNQSASFNAIGSGAPGAVAYTISGGSFGSLPATATVVPSELVVQTNSATLGESPEVTVSTAAVIGGAPVIEEVALNQTVTVTVTSSPPNIGSITNPTVSIGGGSFSGTTFFQPAALGQATITASASGFSAGTTQLTVTNGSTLQISNGASVGQFLENQNSMTLGQPAPSGGLPVTLSVASGSIGLMQLAVNPTDPGSNSIVVTVPAGQHSASYYVYALQPSGTATYSATAPGFGSASDTMTLAPSGIDIFETTPQGSPICAINCNVSLAAGAQTFSILVNQLSNDGNNTIVEQQNLAGPTGSSAAATTGTASSGSTALIVASGTGLTTGQLVIGPGIAPGTFLVSGGGTSWVLSQATVSALNSTSLAFYNAGLSVTVNNSPPGAGTLSSGTAIVTPGTGFGSLTFTPVTSGSTTLSVTQPNGFLSPRGFPGSELTQVAVTVGP